MNPSRGRGRVVASLFALLAPAALAADGAASGPAPLYVLSSEGTTAEDGRPLTMTVREVERAPDFSIVDVELVAGGSAAQLFLVRGLCGVMRAREHTVAVAEQVAERPVVEFRMTFPASAKVEDTKGLPRLVLSEADCARLQGPPR